jgi:hypothetical protein
VVFLIDDDSICSLVVSLIKVSGCYLVQYPLQMHANKAPSAAVVVIAGIPIMQDTLRFRKKVDWWNISSKKKSFQTKQYLHISGYSLAMNSWEFYRLQGQIPMILTKFDPPVKILRVKLGLLKIWRAKESFQGSNGHPVIIIISII